MPTRPPVHQQGQAKQYKRQKDRDRPSPRKMGYTTRWDKARKQYLKQNPLCVECKKHGRAEPANVVDHIIPHRGDMKLFWNQDNWRALCARCHNRKTATEDGGFGISNTTVVFGAPCSGKTTYCTQRMKRGDLLIDLDLIVAAISNRPIYDKPENILPYAWEARDAIIDKVCRDGFKYGNVWITCGYPEKHKRDALLNRLNAKAVYMDTAKDECIERLRSDDRRKDNNDEWVSTINNWYDVNSIG